MQRRIGDRVRVRRIGVRAMVRVRVNAYIDLVNVAQFCD